MVLRQIMVSVFIGALFLLSVIFRHAEKSVLGAVITDLMDTAAEQAAKT